MSTNPDLLSSLRDSPALMRRIEFARFDFDVLSSDQRYRISVRPGQIGFRTETGQPDFIIASSGPAWAEFAKPEPRPGYNDVIAMIEYGHAQLEGDALPFFRHLFFVKGVIGALFRGNPRL